MTAMRTAEQLLSTMTRTEKARLLQRIVRDLGGAFPGIESTPSSNKSLKTRRHKHGSLSQS